MRTNYYYSFSTSIPSLSLHYSFLLGVKPLTLVERYLLPLQPHWASPDLSIPLHPPQVAPSPVRWGQTCSSLIFGEGGSHPHIPPAFVWATRGSTELLSLNTYLDSICHTIAAHFSHSIQMSYTHLSIICGQLPKISWACAILRVKNVSGCPLIIMLSSGKPSASSAHTPSTLCGEGNPALQREPNRRGRKGTGWVGSRQPGMSHNYQQKIRPKLRPILLSLSVWVIISLIKKWLIIILPH